MKNNPINLLFGIILSFCLGACLQWGEINPVEKSTPIRDKSFLLFSPTASFNLTETPGILTSTDKYKPSPTAVAVPATIGKLTVSPSTPVLSNVCTESGGVIIDQYHSSKLNLPLDYRIYLPPCYADQPTRRYPVLYLIHGQSYSDDQWIRLGVAKFADRLILAHQIPPLLIVMPRDRIWAQPPQDPFGEVLVEQLIPFIDENYRTMTNRNYRAIGGLSRGAGWAVHLGLSHWELFSEIGAHSLAVFGSDIQTIPKWLDQIPVNSRPNIFLDIGRNDRPEMLKWTLWFEQLLTEKNFPHEWYYYDGYHDEAYWSAHVEQYLRWYTQAWMTSNNP